MASSESGLLAAVLANIGGHFAQMEPAIGSYNDLTGGVLEELSGVVARQTEKCRPILLENYGSMFLRLRMVKLTTGDSAADAGWPSEHDASTNGSSYTTTVYAEFDAYCGTDSRLEDLYFFSESFDRSGITCLTPPDTVFRVPLLDLPVMVMSNLCRRKDLTSANILKALPGTPAYNENAWEAGGRFILNGKTYMLNSQVVHATNRTFVSTNTHGNDSVPTSTATTVLDSLYACITPKTSKSTMVVSVFGHSKVFLRERTGPRATPRSRKKSEVLFAGTFLLEMRYPLARSVQLPQGAGYTKLTNTDLPLFVMLLALGVCQNTAGCCKMIMSFAENVPGMCIDGANWQQLEGMCALTVDATERLGVKTSDDAIELYTTQYGGGNLAETVLDEFCGRFVTPEEWETGRLHPHPAEAKAHRRKIFAMWLVESAVMCAAGNCGAVPPESEEDLSMTTVYTPGRLLQWLLCAALSKAIAFLYSPKGSKSVGRCSAEGSVGGMSELALRQHLPGCLAGSLAAVKTHLVTRMVTGKFVETSASKFKRSELPFVSKLDPLASKDGLSTCTGPLRVGEAIAHARTVDRNVVDPSKADPRMRRPCPSTPGMLCPLSLSSNERVGLTKQMTTVSETSVHICMPDVFACIEAGGSSTSYVAIGKGIGAIGQVYVSVNGQPVGSLGAHHTAKFLKQFKMHRVTRFELRHLSISTLTGHVRIRSSQGRMMRPLEVIPGEGSPERQYDGVSWPQALARGWAEYLDIEEMRHCFVAARDLASEQQITLPARTGRAATLKSTHWLLDDQADMFSAGVAVVPHQNHNPAGRGQMTSKFVQKQTVTPPTSNLFTLVNSPVAVDSATMLAQSLCQTSFDSLVRRSENAAGVMQVSGGANLLVANIPHPATAEDGIAIREGALHQFTTDVMVPIVLEASSQVFRVRTMAENELRVRLAFRSEDKSYVEYNPRTGKSVAGPEWMSTDTHGRPLEAFDALQGRRSFVDKEFWGKYIRSGDVVIASRNEVSAFEEGRRRDASDLSGEPSQIYSDASKVFSAPDTTWGQVVCGYRSVRVENVPGNKFRVVETTKVLVRYTRRARVGDKFSSRHGQKSILTAIIPDAETPFTADGQVPDLLFNSHAFPTRMTYGQLLEMGDSVRAAETGVVQDGSSFLPSAHRTDVETLHTMTNPITGERIQGQVFMGFVYYIRMMHICADKVQTRGESGPNDPVTGQPVQGKKRGGGTKVGEMETAALIASGATSVIADRGLTSTDSCTIKVCTLHGRKAFVSEDQAGDGRRVWSCPHRWKDTSGRWRGCTDPDRLVDVMTTKSFSVFVDVSASMGTILKLGV